MGLGTGDGTAVGVGPISRVQSPAVGKSMSSPFALRLSQRPRTHTASFPHRTEHPRSQH